MLNIHKKTDCTGHRAAIYALVQGKDVYHFISAGGDGWVTEWNINEPETGKVIANIGNQIFSLCAIPEKTRLIAGNMTGGVHWIDLLEPEKTRNVQHHNSKGVYDLQNSGQWVFSAGGDGVLTRWALETQKAIESLHLSNQALRSIACSNDRQLMAIGASDGSVYILNTDTFGILKVIKDAHKPSVFATKFSPDGQHLITGGRDAMLRIWDIHNDFALLSEIPAHLYTINQITYSPDNNLLVTASRDKTIKIWDAKTFQLLKVVDTFKNGGHINSVNRLFWQNGYLLSASDDRTIKIWDLS